MLKFAKFLFIALMICPAFASMPADVNLGIDGLKPISLNEAENLKAKNAYFLDTNTPVELGISTVR